jgi:hypothetical protein
MRLTRYCGFYLIIFESTTPDEGRIWINAKEANRDDVIALLQFDEATMRRYWCRVKSLIDIKTSGKSLCPGGAAFATRFTNSGSAARWPSS